MYSDKFTTVDGLRLHYTEWGDPDAPAMLCVGGVIQECHVWDDFAERLCHGYRVICLDLRGQGDSDWSRAGYSTASFVRDIHGFARRIGLLPFHFVGHSLGARIAIAYGGTFPDDVRSVVLSDFGPSIDRERALANRASMLGYWQRGILGFRTEGEAVEFFRDMNPQHQPKFHRIYARHNVRLNWANRLVMKADPDLFFLNSSAVAAEMPQLWKLAEKVTAPTMLARSTNEEIKHVSDEMAQRMADVFPALVVEDFQTDHYVPLEAPEEFAEAVRRHADKAETASTVE